MLTIARICRTVARVALSLFVVWQFVFLVGYNFLNVEKPLREAFKDWYWQEDWHKDVPIPEYLEGNGTIHKDVYQPATVHLKRWSQLTGQPES
jgi:hypothetical protein